jgi:hypothetical protein
VVVRVAAGVPLITQVEALITSPAGSAGVEVQFEIAAPLPARVVGAILIATPTVPLVPVAPAKLKVGTLTPVERVTSAAVEGPAEFVAVMLKIVGAMTPEGVPEITQVVVLRLKPAGRPGVTLQFEIAAPLFARVVGVTVIATPTVPLAPAAPA